jgi:hypothetical protein
MIEYNKDRWNMDFTETFDGKIWKGDTLKFPDGKIKRIAHIIYINMLVDRFDFEDGSSCFCGDEFEVIKDKE